MVMWLGLAEGRGRNDVPHLGNFHETLQAVFTHQLLESEDPVPANFEVLNNGRNTIWREPGSLNDYMKQILPAFSINHIGLQCEQETPLLCLATQICSCQSS